MFSIGLKGLLANLSRFVATLVAIATGVGFLTAGTMVTNSIENSLGAEVDRQYADVAVAVRLRNADTEFGLQRGGIPVEEAEPISSVDGVRAVAGQVAGFTRLIDDPDAADADPGDPDRRQGPSVRAWVDDDGLNPLDIVDGRAPQREPEITVDRGFAEQKGIGLGDTVAMASGEGRVDVRVVGITRFGTTDSPDLTGTVTAAEPWVFTLGAVDPPAYTDVLVAGDGSRSDAELAAAITDELEEGLVAVTGDRYREDAKGDTAAILGLLRPILQGFSLLAIFVCGFVIYNTFSVIVSQRIRELALMRAVAATPRQVRRSLRVEGLAVGLIGSLLGIGFGVALTYLLSAVLKAFDLDLPSAEIALTPAIVVSGLLIGTVITLLSAFVPAWRAGRTAPIEAMRDHALEPKGISRPRLITFSVLILIGVALMIPGNGWLLGPGALFFMLGVFGLGPALVAGVTRVTRPMLAGLGPVGRLASDNLGRNPRRSSTTMNALVVGVLLVALVTAAGSTLKRAAVDEVNKYSSADFIVAAASGSMDSGLLDQIEDIDGVQAMARLRSLPVRVDGRPDGLSAADPADLIAIGLTTDEGSLDELGEGVAMANLDGTVSMGAQKVFTDVRGEEIPLEVTAVMSLSVDVFTIGSLVTPETLDRVAPGTEESGALLSVDPDRVDEVARELDRLTVEFGNVQVIEGNLFGQLIGGLFDFLINVINGLLGMSVVIALIGIVNTLTLSVFERRRELGLLRAVGMTTRSVRRMVRLEALQLAVLGTVVGLVSGVVLAWLLLRTSDIGGIDLQWGRFGILLGVGVLIGVVASIAPTRRVTKLNVLEAITVE